MGKQCFTCSHKIVTEITSLEQKRAIYKEEAAKGNYDSYVGEQDYHCKLTGERISQTEPACDNYFEDKWANKIRTIIAKNAEALQKELK